MYVSVLGHWLVADDVIILGLWVVFWVYPTCLKKVLVTSRLKLQQLHNEKVHYYKLVCNARD